MSQISHWFDLSQVYNSIKKNFDFLSRDKRDPSKLATDTGALGRDQDKIRMPSCPNNNSPQQLQKISNNCNNNVAVCQNNILPNGCFTCQVPTSQRTGNTPNPIAPPSRAPGTRDGCFIGGIFV